MSLKSAIVDYSAFDGMQNREGVEGFLIGAVNSNSFSIFHSFLLENRISKTRLLLHIVFL